jgi:transposase
MITASHRAQLRTLLAQKNDLTLKELRTATALKCSLQAINVVLGTMGLTYKKRPSVPANRIAPTSLGRGGSGRSGRLGLTRPS